MVSDLMGMHRIELIGREKYIKQILQIASIAERRGSAAFIYIEGEGGIGKTALLEEIRRRLMGRQRVIVANQLIDLYHLDYQTSYGFSEAVAAALSDEQAEFEKFMDRIKEFHEARNHGQTEQAGRLWNEAEREFAATLRRISERQQVWIWLDTAEVLHIDHSALSEETEMAPEHVSKWLLKVMPQFTRHKLVFLTAGRPPEAKGEGFFAFVKRIHGWVVEDPIKLWPLEPEECRDYLAEVATYLEKNKADGFNGIRNYLSKYGYNPLHRETEGRPLYLAMVSDILRTGGTLPEGFYLTEKVGDSKKTEDQAILTDHFLKLRSPIGITLRAMAMLHKGVDSDLLARVMLIGKDEAERNLGLVDKLTLVKRRQGDVPRPYFLHDEIYDLYARRAFPDRERKTTYQYIRDYYDWTMEQLDRDMRRYPYLLTRYQNRRRMAQIEMMHYALWFYPWLGFAEYFAQSGNALSMHVNDWDLLLENEFQRTQAGLERAGRFPEELRHYIQWDERIRAIERVSIKPGASQKAREMLDKLRVDESAPAFSKAYWWFLQGMMSARGQAQNTASLSNPDVALDEAEKWIHASVPDIGLEKAVKVLRAFIENYRGYSARRAGKYEMAMKHYQRAAAIMRQYDLGGLSGVLSNQAYAMSMLGFDRRARETAREAYEVAQRANSPRDQIRALNVRASVETLAGDAKIGEKCARQGLEILHLNPEPRLEALVYVSLGRACRYAWNQALGEAFGEPGVADRQPIMEGLTYFEGEEYVKDVLKWNLETPVVEHGAIELLSSTPDAENLSAARNECGCLWREVAWILRHAHSERDEKVMRTGQIAETRLKQAAGVQDVTEQEWLEAVKKQVRKMGGSPYWPALALANLAWHYHYQRRPSEEVERICAFVEEVIESTVGSSYLWREALPNVLREEADAMIWAALGKMEMARGYESLRKWRKEPIKLEDAIRHIALAMEYNYLIGQTSFNMRRAEMGLENRIRQSENWERKLLPLFYERALQVTPRLGLPVGKAPRLLRWLEERYGSSEDWIKSSGEES
ncbi:MAG: AAA family ATPase [Chloroflexota bacterium]